MRKDTPHPPPDAGMIEGLVRGIFDAMEAALASATRKRHGDDIDVRVSIDRETGDLGLVARAHSGLTGRPRRPLELRSTASAFSRVS